jgi:hypothetical protein
MQYGGANMDPPTLAINSVRGEAMSVVVQYALWVRRHLDERNRGTQDSATGLIDMPEAMTVLDRHLDPSIDPSPAVRSVYGRYLPWLILLDEVWVESNLSRIFPADSRLADLRDAAWNTYIAYCAPFDRPFDLLHSQYRDAIERLGSETEQLRSESPESRLADHLMTYYWRGKIDLAKGAMIERFYANAAAPLRAHATAAIGHGLFERDETTPIPEEVLARSRALWDWRRATLESLPPEPGSTRELSEFGWWFASGAFDDRWALEQLLAVAGQAHSVDAGNRVLTRLESTAMTEPLLTIKVLSLLIQSDKEGWRILIWTDQVSTVIRRVLSSDDEDARRLALQTVHDLGARGYREYRSLASAEGPAATP